MTEFMRWNTAYCIEFLLNYRYPIPIICNLFTSTSDVTSANFDHVTQQYGCAHALAILTLKMANKNNTQFADGKKALEYVHHT